MGLQNSEPGTNPDSWDEGCDSWKILFRRGSGQHLNRWMVVEFSLVEFAAEIQKVDEIRHYLEVEVFIRQTKF